MPWSRSPAPAPGSRSWSPTNGSPTASRQPPRCRSRPATRSPVPCSTTPRQRLRTRTLSRGGCSCGGSAPTATRSPGPARTRRPRQRRSGRRATASRQLPRDLVGAGCRGGRVRRRLLPALHPDGETDPGPRPALPVPRLQHRRRVLRPRPRPTLADRPHPRRQPALPVPTPPPHQTTTRLAAHPRHRRGRDLDRPHRTDPHHPPRRRPPHHHPHRHRPHPHRHWHRRHRHHPYRRRRRRRRRRPGNQQHQPGPHRHPRRPTQRARVPPRTPRRRPTRPPSDTNTSHRVARRPRPAATAPTSSPSPRCWCSTPRDGGRTAAPGPSTALPTLTCRRSDRGAGHPLGRSRVWPSPPGDTHTHLFGGSRSKSGTVPQPWVATSGRGESEYPTGASGSTTPSRNAGRSPSDRGSRWFGQQSRTAQEGTDVHPHHCPGHPAAPCRHPARGRRPRRRPGDQRVRRPTASPP